MKIIHDAVQGTAITFNANFYDLANNLITPNSATLTLSFYVNAEPASNTLAMSYSNTANAWTQIWDSGASDVGAVTWKIFGESVNNVASQGTFRLL